MPLGNALAEQFDRAWEMLIATVQRCPPERWGAGARPDLVPARWALHAVETVDFYAQDAPDGFAWGGRFGVDWEGAEAAELPSQEQIVDYAQDVRYALARWLRASSDDDLLADSAFPWCGATVLERVLYALRHTHQHVGELTMLLRVDGAHADDWR